eukprot:jgi/Chrpa1/10089/Chrysochromulina_OHIO_Genome00007791-RA
MLLLHVLDHLPRKLFALSARFELRKDTRKLLFTMLFTRFELRKDTRKLLFTCELGSVRRLHNRFELLARAFVFLPLGQNTLVRPLVSMGGDRLFKENISTHVLKEAIERSSHQEWGRAHEGATRGRRSAGG